jgi:hypothetical protein
VVQRYYWHSPVVKVTILLLLLLLSGSRLLWWVWKKTGQERQETSEALQRQHLLD